MEQNSNTSLIEKSKQWWFGLNTDEKRVIVQKYYNDSRGIPAFTYSEIDELYLSEHPTEAEVSKEEETLNYAACKYEKMANDMGNSHRLSFETGAAWQKEKDRVLISELLEVLKWTGKFVVLNEESKKAITKAEKHLNNQ